MTTIAQALKEKNRIITSIKKTKEKISQHNQVVKGDTRAYNINDLYKQLIKDQDSLVKIKTNIHKASEPVRSTIFLQSELKDRIAFLKKLPHGNGTVRERYSSGEGYEVESTLGSVEIDTQIEELEKEIDSLQDVLDKFNHITSVDL